MQSRESLVSLELNPLLQRLPTKFETIYDYQIDAITEIVQAFEDDYKLVVLEAPTGSGKTFIAECVRLLLKTRACYICHNKELQAQFAREFPYSKRLFGRANYIPPRQPIFGNVTCEDCQSTKTRPECEWCPVKESCPYTTAKRAAISSPVPVLNSAYWLNEIQGDNSRFRGTGLAILDEADTLEQVLMGQVEVYISERAKAKYHIKPPQKLTVQASYHKWVEETLDLLREPIEKLAVIELPNLAEQRELNRLSNLYSTLSVMQQDLNNEQPWIYTGGAGRKKAKSDVISFKPVKVDKFGVQRIWNKERRYLLMAALIPDITISSLGWQGAFKRVSIESQFHPRNRQVVVKPLANVTQKGFDDEQLQRLTDGVHTVLAQHSTDRVLIHSVSYSLRQQLQDSLRGQERRVFTYLQVGDRARAIQDFKEVPASILLAPGLERGIDLPHDLCRAQVIVKVPFLSLGDKQVNERLHNTPDGPVWYNQHVATTILQMVGRGVRDKEDYCTCYILDSTFVSWYKSWGHLLPQWFKKAIRIEYDKVLR